MDMFRIGFLTIGVVDLIDIAAVTFIFYKIFLLLRGTRAAPMVVGLLVLLIVAVIAKRTEMSGLSWLLTQVQTVWLVAIVIVFQAELRRLLVHLGRTRFIRLFYSAVDTHVVDQIVEAAGLLSTGGLGALIVLTRETGLAGIVETGLPLRADVRSELLVSLFLPKSPLHDGAAIVTGEQIEAVRCILPLTQREIDPNLGTRHRAAIGMSEESDALVVVVSEENSAISLAVDGEITSGLTPTNLGAMLRHYLEQRATVPDGAAQAREF